MPKTLLLLRHGKSSWSDPDADDHDRSLTRRGVETARLAARAMEEAGHVPELVVSSPAVRTRATAEVCLEEWSVGSEHVRVAPALYEGGIGAYIGAIHAASDDVECLMVVGHKPSLEELVAALTGERVDLPTAAWVRIGLEIDSWREVAGTRTGELVTVWRPPR